LDFGSGRAQARPFSIRASRHAKIGPHLTRGDEQMKRIMILLMAVSLAGCGTARGAGHGIGEVLAGMGEDFRALGDLFER